MKGPLSARVLVLSYKAKKSKFARVLHLLQHCGGVLLHFFFLPTNETCSPLFAQPFDGQLAKMK